ADLRHNAKRTRRQQDLAGRLVVVVDNLLETCQQILRAQQYARLIALKLAVAKPDNAQRRRQRKYNRTGNPEGARQGRIRRMLSSERRIRRSIVTPPPEQTNRKQRDKIEGQHGGKARNA